MSFLIGRGRTARETYPSVPRVGGQSPATLETAWFQDYVGGNNNNDGLTPATAVKEFGEIYRRWQGGIAGTRPRIPQSAIIEMISPVPPGNFTDPILRLADIDLAPGAVVKVKPFALTIKRTSTLTAVPNAFARTATGRLQVADATVASWASDIDHLLVDTTKGVTTWVTAAPVATNAQLAAPRSSFNDADAAIFFFLSNGLGGPTALAPGDSYEIVTPQDAYFGTGSYTRQWPTSGANAGVNLPSAFVIEGMRAVSQGAGDVCRVSSDGSFSPVILECGANVVLANCRIDPELQLQGGALTANCFTSVEAHVGGPDASVSASLLAGYGRSSVFMLGGGNVDDDFSIISVGAVTFAIEGDRNFFGNVGFYGDGTAEAIFVTDDADISFGPDFEATGIFYGQTLGQVFYIGDDNSYGHVVGGQTATTTFVFDTLTFQLGSQSSGWGFNRATGTYTGPTTFTVPHIDAALAAGTGFGGVAIDPKTNTFLGVFGT